LVKLVTLAHIAFDIATYLRDPKPLVCGAEGSGKSPVAAFDENPTMPIVAIHKYRYSCAPEHYIGRSWKP
jgi:hypothetical protein